MRATVLGAAGGVGLLVTVLLAGCTASTKPAAAGSSSGSASGSSPGAPSGSAPDLQSAYVSTIAHVLPSVAQIETTSGLGSGVVFDDQGDIVTNDHVVGSARQFKITLANDPRSLDGTLVGTFPSGDLAVVRVSGAKNLHPATFGDSSALQVGDIVLAVGNPLGLTSSVTNGIVSALGRTVTEPQSADSPGATLPDSIQTSAAINPGNSGGALVDLQGQVIGIPTLAALDAQEGGGAAPGIGFAISGNIAKDIAAQLVKSGKVTNSHRAALEVTVAPVTDQNGQAAGVGVVSVTAGGAAAKAGIARGDVLQSVNGTSTPSAQALSSVLAGLSPGQAVPVTYLDTTGTSKKVTVTLGTLPG